MAEPTTHPNPNDSLLSGRSVVQRPLWAMDVLFSIPVHASIGTFTVFSTIGTSAFVRDGLISRGNALTTHPTCSAQFNNEVLLYTYLQPTSAPNVACYTVIFSLSI